MNRFAWTTLADLQRGVDRLLGSLSPLARVTVEFRCRKPLYRIRFHGRHTHYIVAETAEDALIELHQLLDLYFALPGNDLGARKHLPWPCTLIP